jgi:hypothetical protein
MLLLSSSCASAEFRGDTAEVFRCRDGSELTVQYQQQAATVIAGGHSYVLRRRPSNIGERFTSPLATLIVDGDFAAFVADDLHDLRGCARG